MQYQHPMGHAAAASRRSPIPRALLLLKGLLLLLVMLAASRSGVAGSRARPPATAQQPEAVLSPAQPRAAAAQLPLSFEPNVGQTDADVQFLARGRGYSLALTADAAVFALRALPAEPTPRAAWDDRPSALPVPTPGTALRLQLLGATATAPAVGLDLLPGRANYFLGANPRQWYTDLPTYARVAYRDVYPGVDVVYYGAQGQLEYDFVVAPGADPTAVRLGYAGAESLRLDAAGNLVLALAGGEVVQHAPVIYQERAGVRVPVPGGYTLTAAGEVAFTIPVYDAGRPLVIDPVLVYSTYLGGTGFDTIGSGQGGLAVDAAGNAYVTGTTDSPNFPTTPGAFQSSGGGVYVAKLNATGTALLYSTFLGGGSSTALTVDGAGNAYITGSTFGGYPTTPGAYQQFIVCCSTEVFVTKLNPTGSALVYSTFLGGSTADTAFGIAIDGAGNAYVTGQSQGDLASFPTTPGALHMIGGERDVFVAKFNATGSALVYSALFGGDDFDRGSAIAVDGAGNAYVSGLTRSANFPTTPGAFQTTKPGGFDAIVFKLNPSGSAFVYSTYLGGAGFEEGTGLAVDGAGNAYVSGDVNSPTFPTTPGALRTTIAGGLDAFVAKVNPTGSALLAATYLGGSGTDAFFGSFVALDPAGNVYVTGATDSTDFPVTAGAFQAVFGGSGPGISPGDVFVAKLNPTLSALGYATYLGGASHDTPFAIVVDGAGNAYVFGETASTNFPTTPNALQPAYGGGFRDAFVAKISPANAAADLTVDKFADPQEPHAGQPFTYTVTVKNNGPDLAIGVTLTDTLPTGVTFSAVTPGAPVCTQTGGVVTCAVGTLANGGSFIARITGTATTSGQVVNTARVTSATPDPNLGNNTVTYPTQVMAARSDVTVWGSVSGSTQLGGTLTYTLTVKNNGPDGATGVALTDSFGTAVTGLSATSSSTGVNCTTTAATNTVSCTIGNLASGGQAVVTVTARGTARGNLSNTATATSTSTDPNSGNDTASLGTWIS